MVSLTSTDGHYILDMSQPPVSQLAFIYIYNKLMYTCNPIQVHTYIHSRCTDQNVNALTVSREVLLMALEITCLLLKGEYLKNVFNYQ